MKIDKNLIPNFDELSADELREAIANLDIKTDNENKNNDDEIAKLKAALNKASSEASDFKKQLREKMSTEEKEKAEKEAADKEKDELIAKLLRNQDVTNYTAKLIGLGMSEADAKKTAETMPSGLKDTFFEACTNLKSDIERKVKAEITKGTPRPDGGSEKPEGVTKEQFNKMGYMERLELKKNNPTEYENLKGGADDV